MLNRTKMMLITVDSRKEKQRNWRCMLTPLMNQPDCKSLVATREANVVSLVSILQSHSLAGKQYCPVVIILNTVFGLILTISFRNINIQKWSSIILLVDYSCSASQLGLPLF